MDQIKFLDSCDELFSNIGQLATASFNQLEASRSPADKTPLMQVKEIFLRKTADCSEALCRCLSEQKGHGRDALAAQRSLLDSFRSVPNALDTQNTFDLLDARFAEVSKDLEEQDARLDEEAAKARLAFVQKYFEKLSSLLAAWIPSLCKRVDINRPVIDALRSVLEHVSYYRLASRLDRRGCFEPPLDNVEKLFLPFGPPDIGRGALVSAFSRLIADGKLSFPFKRFSMSNPDDMFQRLRSYRPTIEHKPYQLQNIRFVSNMFHFDFLDRPTLLVSPPDDYHLIDAVSDYFQEEARLAGRRSDQNMSPMQHWQSPQHNYRLLDYLIDKRQSLSTHNLREASYALWKECTQFKPTLVKSIIDLLGGRRLLDFSAGWGDRLTGAIAAGVESYLATDPNVALKPGHDAIIRRFAGDRADSFRVIYEPFQHAALPPDSSFNLVFTSPPFFDFEIYTDLPGQSAEDFPRQDDWLVNFLFFSLRKAWQYLEMEGHMAIHISDVYKTKVCEPMNLFVQANLPGAFYCGVVGSSGLADKPRPIWIWRKTPHTDSARAERAAQSLQQHFPSAAAKVPAMMAARVEEGPPSALSALKRTRDEFNRAAAPTIGGGVATGDRDDDSSFEDRSSKRSRDSAYRDGDNSGSTL